MRYGFVGSSGTVQQVLEQSVAADTTGWDGFFTWDAISVGAAETWDPWTLLAAAAVRTERVRLGAMVFALARRRPWKVAREALTVDHLSGGRLVLPVGLGVPDDGGFARVNGEASTAHERAERLDESLAILDLAWRGEPFSFTGRHNRVDGLELRPRPVQRPRIPVWVVGAWPSARSIARAARWDGVVLQRLFGGEPLGVEDVRSAMSAVARARDRLRADGVALPERYDVVVSDRLSADRLRAADLLAGLADAGVTWWVESRWDAALDTPQTLLAAIREGPPGC